jgi:5'-deoxynucleotidase YfbR-like HD superfamily hydrolase
MAHEWSDGGAVETYTGRGFDVFDPDPATVALDDIAAGLAHTCRFGGHPQRFYSVAEHSLYVATELADEGDGRLALLGLLHDAGEAYVGDIPRPVKRRLDGFEEIEAAVLAAVWDGLDVDPPTESEWKRVMTVDDRLLAYEADELLADGSWADEPAALGYDLGRRPVDEVRERFRTRAEALLGG